MDLLKNLPEPLRGLDNGKSGFTYTSIVKRLPAILTQMINENNFEKHVVNYFEGMIKDIQDEHARIEAFEDDPQEQDNEITKHNKQVWKTWTEKYLTLIT
jgi:hypothetical protein